MRILAIDIGTGTQDILLFDTQELIENSVKLVAPSPTMRVAASIQVATARRRPVLFTGPTMGGGPCAWALEQHMQAALTAFATPDAARTFDDDLAAVERIGVHIIGDDEAARLQDVIRIELGDVDLAAIRSALTALGAEPRFDAIAVACLDHGAAPPGYSDRLFRFEHLRRVVESNNDLFAFAYRPEELPPYLTRARAATASAMSASLPAVFLDTAPAAALGALQDDQVAQAEQQLVINLGNSHALAFHLRGTHIYSLFEHHTGLLESADIESLCERLLAGTLTHEDVFEGNGHGVFYAEKVFGDKPFVAVTGPQRRKLAESRLRPHFAVPHGDMMLSGCFGLLQAFAAKYPSQREEIEAALAGG